MLEINVLKTKINEAVAYARKKHPVWPENSFEQLAVITEELGEISQAINDQDLEKARHEAYQTIDTLIRFLEGK